MKQRAVVLRAIFPNYEVQTWYRQKLQELVRAMFRDALRSVKAVYTDDAPQIGFAHDAADPVVTLRRSLTRWGSRWEKRLTRASEELSRRFADKTRKTTDVSMTSALRKAGFTVRFQPTEGMVSAYRATIAEQVGLIKSIGQKFHTDIQSAVWSSVMKGSDMGALAKNLQHSYGVSWRRAALISRDQSAKAKAIFEEQRRGELGITSAIWQHSHAGRVPRKSHLAMNGKEYDIRKGMWDSDEKAWVWPGTLINCRCSSRSIIPGLRAA